MELSDADVGEMARLMSHERLAGFVAITGTERDALELHHEMMLLQGALTPVIGHHRDRIAKRHMRAVAADAGCA